MAAAVGGSYLRAPSTVYVDSTLTLVVFDEMEFRIESMVLHRTQLSFPECWFRELGIAASRWTSSSWTEYMTLIFMWFISGQ